MIALNKALDNPRGILAIVDDPFFRERGINQVCNG